jgi:hypothetical protein
VTKRLAARAGFARWFLGALCALTVGANSWAQMPSDCPPAAQPPSAEQMRLGMRDARDRGFLWRISKDGHSSYLYGTVHVAKMEWMFPGPAVTSALRTSNTIALELDVLDPQVQQQLNEAMTAVAEEPLPDALQQRIRLQAQANACRSRRWTAMRRKFRWPR